MTFRKVLNEYALYKGDTLLTVGTIKEIAQEMGITEKAVRHYGTPRYERMGPLGKSPNPTANRRRLILLEDDE